MEDTPFMTPEAWIFLALVVLWMLVSEIRGKHLAYILPAVLLGMGLISYATEERLLLENSAAVDGEPAQSWVHRMGWVYGTGAVLIGLVVLAAIKRRNPIGFIFLLLLMVVVPLLPALVCSWYQAHTDIECRYRTPVASKTEVCRFCTFRKDRRLQEMFFDKIPPDSALTEDEIYRRESFLTIVYSVAFIALILGIAAYAHHRMEEKREQEEKENRPESAIRKAGGWRGKQ